jgi:hypothetical protein
MRERIGVAVAIAAAIVALGAPAAVAKSPFALFADCPVNAPGVSTCVFSDITSGEFTLGAKNVKINKPVILQGGLAGGVLVPASNGETLSKTALTVPGGLLGIEGLGGEVTATAELAGTVNLNVGKLLDAQGTAVSLPLQVKLDNPLLGSSCLIGSSRNPVELELTTGTTNPPHPNKPITGSPGHLTLKGGIQVVSGGSLVDNSFSVPGAEGCGGLLFLLIDPAVDLAAGVPAAAGHNTAILSGTLETASASEVKTQLALPEVGRCVRTEGADAGKGNYVDKGCTEETVSHDGEYEWLAGPGPKPKLTSTAHKVTLEGVSGATVTCKTAGIAGEYTGPKTASATITLSGCVYSGSGEACQSAKAPAGEIVTNSLTGSLGFIEDEVTEAASKLSIGLDLSAPGSLLSAECAGLKEPLVVSGSAIAPIGKIDKMASSFKTTYAASTGKQQVEQFEETPRDVLTATLGSGAQQAGLLVKLKLVNEEQMEIRAEHN